MPGARRAVALLGVGQTLAWASSYYLAAMLAQPMAAEFGLPTSAVFGAVSAALVVAALLGPAVGRTIDARGGRRLLAASNLVFVLGLLLLAAAPDAALLVAGWLVLGIGMAMGLYDAAFAALAGLFGRAARGPITGITLIAGFASTVGWPLTAALAEAFGWRGACLGWAALHVVLGLPLHLALPRGSALPRQAADRGPEAAAAEPPPRFAAPLLAFVFAINLFVASAMSAHLPRLLAEAGASTTAAIAAAALVGPAQVAGRIAEFGLLRHVTPLASARMAALAHPAGAALLGLFAAVGAIPFAILHGLGNGVLTIARGTLPLLLFGAAGYGARQGWLAAPGRLLMAAAPLTYGLLLDGAGVAAALWLTGGVSVLAWMALLALRPGRGRPDGPR